MNEYRDDKTGCYIHPKEVVIGVCALCLNQKLLVLASKQSKLKGSDSVYSGTYRKPSVSLSNLFALSSLLNRLDFGQHKSQPYFSSSTSQEDSFISIKFENNGVPSWDKDPISKISLGQQCDMSLNHDLSKVKKIKSVVEHSKLHPMLRWQKRIGHLFQLIRWKKSSKGHVSIKLKGVKIKHGWIRSLTRKRTKE
ncbi:uncharacterized protein LOC111402754 [Olea europaea var. sylvestris]|uniref:uncharacterized protein LOC111402754 n=1 Tax=Olea europaea var. sylvestris TaxID=158386 RepID=UPI000C1D3BED|nr:uncharacterized protein LOC111402754 [Olea europaea var. sylvestris]